MTEDTQEEHEKAFLIAVDTGEEDGWTAGESLLELAALVEAAGGEVVGSVWQKRANIQPNLYLGTGKADELKAAKASHGIHGGRRR